MSCDKKREFLESLLAFFLECSREFVYLSELVEESLFPAVVHVLRSYKYLIKCDRDEQGLIRIYPHIRIKICERYIRDKICRDDSCEKIHLCDKKILISPDVICKCVLSHSMLDGHRNKQMLRKRFLDMNDRLFIRFYHKFYPRDKTNERSATVRSSTVQDSPDYDASAVTVSEEMHLMSKTVKVRLFKNFNMDEIEFLKWFMKLKTGFNVTYGCYTKDMHYALLTLENFEEAEYLINVENMYYKDRVLQITRPTEADYPPQEFQNMKRVIEELQEANLSRSIEVVKASVIDLARKFDPNARQAKTPNDRRRSSQHQVFEETTFLRSPTEQKPKLVRSPAQVFNQAPSEQAQLAQQRIETTTPVQQSPVIIMSQSPPPQRTLNKLHQSPPPTISSQHRCDIVRPEPSVPLNMPRTSKDIVQAPSAPSSPVVVNQQHQEFNIPRQSPTVELVQEQRSRRSVQGPLITQPLPVVVQQPQHQTSTSGQSPQPNSFRLSKQISQTQVNKNSTPYIKRIVGKLLGNDQTSISIEQQSPPIQVAEEPKTSTPHGHGGIFFDSKRTPVPTQSSISHYREDESSRLDSLDTRFQQISNKPSPSSNTSRSEKTTECGRKSHSKSTQTPTIQNPLLDLMTRATQTSPFRPCPANILFSSENQEIPPLEDLDDDDDTNEPVLNTTPPPPPMTTPATPEPVTPKNSRIQHATPTRLSVTTQPSISCNNWIYKTPPNQRLIRVMSNSSSLNQQNDVTPERTNDETEIAHFFLKKLPKRIYTHIVESHMVEFLGSRPIRVLKLHEDNSHSEWMIIFEFKKGTKPNVSARLPEYFRRRFPHIQQIPFVVSQIGVPYNEELAKLIDEEKQKGHLPADLNIFSHENDYKLKISLKKYPKFVGCMFMNTSFDALVEELVSYVSAKKIIHMDLKTGLIHIPLFVLRGQDPEACMNAAKMRFQEKIEEMMSRFMLKEWLYTSAEQPFINKLKQTFQYASVKLRPENPIKIYCHLDTQRCSLMMIMAKCDEPLLHPLLSRDEGLKKFYEEDADFIVERTVALTEDKVTYLTKCVPDFIQRLKAKYKVDIRVSATDRQFVIRNCSTLRSIEIKNELFDELYNNMRLEVYKFGYAYGVCFLDPDRPEYQEYTSSFWEGMDELCSRFNVSFKIHHVQERQVEVTYVRVNKEDIQSSRFPDPRDQTKWALVEDTINFDSIENIDAKKIQTLESRIVLNLVGTRNIDQFRQQLSNHLQNFISTVTICHPIVRLFDNEFNELLAAYPHCLIKPLDDYKLEMTGFVADVQKLRQETMALINKLTLEELERIKKSYMMNSGKFWFYELLDPLNNEPIWQLFNLKTCFEIEDAYRRGAAQVLVVENTNSLIKIDFRRDDDYFPGFYEKDGLCLNLNRVEIAIDVPSFWDTELLQSVTQRQVREYFNISCSKFRVPGMELKSIQMVQNRHLYHQWETFARDVVHCGLHYHEVFMFAVSWDDYLYRALMLGFSSQLAGMYHKGEQELRLYPTSQEAISQTFDGTPLKVLLVVKYLYLDNYESHAPGGIILADALKEKSILPILLLSYE